MNEYDYGSEHDALALAAIAAAKERGFDSPHSLLKARSRVVPYDKKHLDLLANTLTQISEYHDTLMLRRLIELAAKFYKAKVMLSLADDGAITGALLIDATEESAITPEEMRKALSK